MRARLAVGKKLKESGLYTQALVHFKELQKMIPNQWELHFEIADTLLRKGDRRSALSEFQRCWILTRRTSWPRKRSPTSGSVHEGPASETSWRRILSSTRSRSRFFLSRDEDREDLLGLIGDVMLENERLQDLNMQLSNSSALIPETWRKCCAACCRRSTAFERVLSLARNFPVSEEIDNWLKSVESVYFRLLKHA